METGTRVYSAQFFADVPPAAVWVIVGEDPCHYFITREGMSPANGSLRVRKTCVYPVPVPANVLNHESTETP